MNSLGLFRKQKTALTFQSALHLEQATKLNKVQMIQQEVVAAGAIIQTSSFQHMTRKLALTHNA